jgi:hypothetical protein
LLEAHGSANQGTLLGLLAVPCLLTAPGVASVLGIGVAALAIETGQLKKGTISAIAIAVFWS